MSTRGIATVSVGIVLIVIAAGTYFYQSGKQEDTKNTANTTSNQTNKNTAMQPTTESSYITQEQYAANADKYADKTKVYFFHAAWCHICQGIEEEIENDASQIPADTVLIKVDFDSATKLRQQYGVTIQYTFVQIDNSGKELAQWSATSLSAAIAGIKG